MNDTEIILTIVISTLVILLLIAGIILTISFANRQRLQQQMKFAATELEYQKELRTAETEIREEVMTQLARELHDNIGQLLTVMRLEIENKKLDMPELEVAFAPVEQTLENASDQVRMLSRSLNNDFITRQGLHLSLKQEVQRLQQLRRPVVHYQNSASIISLDENQQLLVFRIFQEMINNSLKHARAQNIYISVTETDFFTLEVKDDGKGFNYELLMQSPKASGLLNMRKRAAMACLDIQVQTHEGKGCVYKLKTIKNNSVSV